jgi:hypothetical protein
MRFRLALLVLAACTGHADVRNCVCDLSSPTIAETRGCSLCLEVEKHPATEKIILTHDNDPTKPNRWLALPREKYDGANPLAQMSPEQRLLLWNAAIAKAKELWGDAWGIAMNGDMARRQCHAHIHIGKLLDEKKAADADTGKFIDGPAELPAISDGTGLWFHPLGTRLHLHQGEQVNETVLMR